MKLLEIYTGLSFCTFALLVNAQPLSELRSEAQLARRKAPYSVVPVDGGQPDGAVPPKTQIVTKDSTQTVTEPPKTMPPVTETILSTTIVTESETPTTIVSTIITTSTPISTQDPAAELPPPVTTTLTTVTSLVSTTDTVIMTTTSTPTLTPYDDGRWHTTYYKPAEPLVPSENSSSAAAEETASPVTDVDAATFTGVPSNGTYALMLRGKNKPKPSNTISTHTTTKSSVMAAIKSKPPMPTLPKHSETPNPTEVPSIDVAKHMVPGFGR
jgi:hypothetical protein